MAGQNPKRFYQARRGALTTFFVFTALPALAQNQHNHNIVTSPAEELFNPISCPSMPISICGQSLWVPSSFLGAQTTFKVPSPYQHEDFTVLCTNVNGLPGFQILNTSAVTCSLLTCAAANVQICNVSLPTPGGTIIGKNIEVAVPPKLLVDPANSGSHIFTAQCKDDGNGGAAYRVTDDSQVSCNLFLCLDSEVQICDASIPIQGGAVLGAVLNLTMPPPFAPDPFAVQCVGSNGNAPIYQVTDHAAVSCDQQAQDLFKP